MSIDFERLSSPARIANPEEGISSDELQLAARNHGMPLESLHWDITPPGLHYLLIHYDIPAIDPSTFELVIDGLVDSFFPILADFDDRIDELEDSIFLRAGDEQLQQIFALKRLLVGLRKAIGPERDLFASLMGGIADLPGMRDDDERYFRDVYDHLIRISDLIDTYRDLLTSTMDVYLSTVSNRMNVVMKQLTIIATIFLPLAWITGFFGQNFGYLVRNITGWQPFFFYGLGFEVVAVVLLFAWFKRERWF